MLLSACFEMLPVLHACFQVPGLRGLLTCAMHTAADTSYRGQNKAFLMQKSTSEMDGRLGTPAWNTYTGSKHHAGAGRNVHFNSQARQHTLPPGAGLGGRVSTRQEKSQGATSDLWSHGTPEGMPAAHGRHTPAPAAWRLQVQQAAAALRHQTPRPARHGGCSWGGPAHDGQAAAIPAQQGYEGRSKRWASSCRTCTARMWGKEHEVG